MRTVADMEASAPELDWVRRCKFAGSGAHFKNTVIIAFYKVD
jgi:hypothetical protein